MKFGMPSMLVLGTVLAVSCNDDSSGGGSSAVGGDLSDPGIYVSSKGPTAGSAGRIDLSSWATIRIGEGSTPAAPSAPGGRALSNADLAADVAASETLVLAGALTTSGSGVRTISSSGGDIVVSGSVTGGNGQGIALNAPSGTVHVLGAVVSPQVSITAATLVLVGTVDAGGEQGGSIRLSANGGPLLLIGGTLIADGSSGPGGAISVEASGGIQGPAIISARGSSGGSVSLAGAEMTLPFGRLEARGGSGGTVDVYSGGGDIVLSSAVDVSGGDAGAQPGAGGTVTLLADISAGSVGVSGTITSRGGSATDAGAAADGGPGGTARLVAYHPAGEVRLHDSAVVDLDGGSSTGTGIAGGGGTVFVETSDGLVSISGRMWLRGGTALGTGGTGGLGGRLEVVSDVNQNGIGPITVEPGGIIDASGGSGTIGGHARHDQTDTATNFPREVSAVSLDSDAAAQSGLGGIIQNLGLIIARGGAPDGWGGDVIFHGFGAPPHREPQSGNLDLAGAGAGLPGNFLGD